MDMHAMPMCKEQEVRLFWSLIGRILRDFPIFQTVSDTDLRWILVVQSGWSGHSCPRADRNVCPTDSQHPWSNRYGVSRWANDVSKKNPADTPGMVRGVKG